ncbi:hypothetical protein BS47DRAFT_1344957 [Hydnum rufescens UP504]|uniref:Membrane insertase YidC/Oxa/ALB C-terminal domain-containing protein n=1 Tax=Hydnum rufescens UP504 TaxID=1448309 RepID=A0A9P6DWK2_9AGAM|nr:hypothetical protein BS47DRAFT_1344957 [Hydnum rufescens UP504]
MQALKGCAHARSPPLPRRAPTLYTSVRNLHVLSSSLSLGSRTTLLNTRRTSDAVTHLYRRRRETRAYWWWGSSTPSANIPPLSTPTSTPEMPPLVQSIPEPTVESAGTLANSTASIPLPPGEELTASSDTIQSVALDMIANGDHLGDLASLGLARWTPTGLLQSLFEQIHVHAGLSWWAVIVVCALSARLLVLPILLRAQVNTLRLTAIRPQLEMHTKQLKAAKDAGDMQTAQKASIRAQKLLKDNDCHPLKSLVGPAVQLPLAISFFTAIRGMCSIPVESMTSGGALWFPDLTIADPYYILPVASSAAMWIMIDTSQKDAPQTASTGHVNNFFRVLSLISVPFIAFLPSGLLIYFSTNGAFMLLQALVFRIPSIRVWAGLPPVSKVAHVKGPTIRESIKAFRKTIREQHEASMREVNQGAFGSPHPTTLSALEKGSQGNARKKTSQTAAKG